MTGSGSPDPAPAGGDVLVDHATCTGVVTGGGYTLTVIGGDVNTSITPLVSFPSDSHTWDVNVKIYFPGNATSVTLTAYAICSPN